MIEVTNLSGVAETESFRVDGLGNARLFVVQCTLDQYQEISKTDHIQDLKLHLRELETEKTAREQEVTVLKAFGKSTAEKPDRTPNQAETFSNAPFDKTPACAESAKDLGERITQLNQRINKIQNSKVVAAFTKANITILADEDGPARLRLIYRGAAVLIYKPSTYLLQYRCT